MKFRFSFIDNEIEISNEFIKCIEVENNNYFIRMIINLNNYSNKDGNCDELIIDENNCNLDLIIDYFNMINNKKDIANIIKYIESKINENDHEKIKKLYNKIVDNLSNTIYELNLPVNINPDYNINKILKLLNIFIENSDNILQNILNYIDINILIQNNILIFINLKSYLSKNELLELYKYCIYNEVTIVLIDNRLYGTTLEYEKKLIIDCNLEEFTI